MSKMAQLIQSKKTAKQQKVFYFAAKEIKPRQPKTLTPIVTTKVYKKLEPKNCGEIGPRGNRTVDTTFAARTGGGNGLQSNRKEGISLWTDQNDLKSEVPIRSDLYGRHAVSVKTKTRQKVSNLASKDKSRQKVSNLAPGQKVSNPMKCEPEQGESVGRGVAPRPCNPDARSSPRLLRGSNKPSGNTGLQTARRPQGHVEDSTHSGKVRTAVRNPGKGGEPQHREPRNGAVSPKYGGQAEDQRTSLVSEVSDTRTTIHKGELPGQVSPTNDAALPSWECLPEYPTPSWGRGRMYEGGNPMRHNVYIGNKWCNHHTHKPWILVLTLLTMMCIVTAQPRSEPQCFLAVHNRRGWWNTRVHSRPISPRTVNASTLATTRRGHPRSNVAAYTLINTARSHRGHPITVTHRLAHIGSEWPPPLLGQGHSSQNASVLQVPRRGQPRATYRRYHNQTNHTGSPGAGITSGPTTSTIHFELEQPAAAQIRGTRQVLGLHIRKTKTLRTQTFSHIYWAIHQTGSLATSCDPTDATTAYFTTNVESQPKPNIDTPKSKETYEGNDKAKNYTQSDSLTEAKARAKGTGSTSAHKRAAHIELASPNYDQVLRHKSGLTQRQKGEYAQRQTQRTNQIERVTATAPRQSRELKLSSQEMDFRETMESEISMLRKRKDRTGSEDTASDSSEDNQSASGVQQ